MMKKLLYGVALALVASVSVGSLQSCKDDVNDLATQTSYNLSKLNSDLTNKLQSLDQNTAAAIAKKADITYVDGLVGDLQVADQQLASQIQGALDRIGGIEALIPEDEIANKAYVDGKAEALQAEIDALKEYVNEGDEALEALIRDTQEALTMALNAHAADIEDINAQLEQILTAIDNIVDMLDKQVTGIIIQGVNSPVFGDFRTPLGVKSNILFNWYGFNSRNKVVEFPSADVVPAALAHEAWNVPVGYYGDDAEGNVTLGKVYVTLNPVGAKFDNIELSIENSAGVALPYTVTLSPSDEVLNHGYTTTRTEENGFYEGEVKMALNDDNVDQIKVTVEENLKTSMKDVLKDPSKTTAKALVKAVFEQLQGTIPAYGLRYGWYNGLNDETDPGFSIGSYSAVLSQYDLAVATAHPLSYNFLDGYSGSGKIPTFSHIDNLIHKLQQDGDIKLDLKPIHIEGADITIGQVTISTDVEIQGSSIVITIPSVTVTGPGIAPGTTTSSTTVTLKPEAELKDVYAAIESGIETALSKVQTDINGWTASMQTDLNKQLNDILKDVEGQVNSMINSINGQIDDMLTNLGNKFQPYFDKINKAIDIYNKVANKLNKILEDPNAYLQVAAFYSMGGSNYGIASGKPSDPTLFQQAGGDSFKLYLSSYTGELIVPACKKYVAVTAVKGDDTRSLADINSAVGEDFNTVLSGNQIEVTVSAAALKAGNVYEFTYQGLDYSGYTSTKKFYIEVK